MEEGFFAHRGKWFETYLVLAQSDYSLSLAEDDGELLAREGFSPAMLEQLHILVDTLQQRYALLCQKGHVQSVEDGRNLVQRAFAWQRILLEIGSNAIGSDSIALQELEFLATPERNIGRLTVQIRNLLQWIRTHDEAFKKSGATDRFYAEGRSIADSLHALKEEKARASADLVEIYDLDSQVVEMLKQLNHAGHAAHMSRLDREAASLYHLNILYGGIPYTAPAMPASGFYESVMD
jgi:hypothetical protein